MKAMYNYDFQSGITVEDLNILGAEGWQVAGVNILSTSTPQTFDALLIQDASRIEVVNGTTGAGFIFDRTISYFDALIIFASLAVIVGWFTAKILNMFLKNNG
jgi:hypothetical protein